MQQAYKAVRITYKEKYKKGAMMLRTLPEFTHTNGATVISVELTEAGCLNNGHEYQILRLELEPSKPCPTCAGRGELEDSDPSVGYGPVMVECQDCRGKGVL